MVQMNLMVEALRYWRNVRKSMEESLDREYHFLCFNKLDFIGNFPTIQRYSLRDDPFTPDRN